MRKMKSSFWRTRYPPIKPSWFCHCLLCIFALHHVSVEDCRLCLRLPVTTSSTVNQNSSIPQSSCRWVQCMKSGVAKEPAAPRPSITTGSPVGGTMSQNESPPILFI
uniref:SFRICE_021300 n=1 Tax=Spodoptera frugiperda TaxID=7108 RepID=A0A2H1VSF2_SPOFR